MTILRRLFIVLALSLLATACATRVATRVVPLPVLPSGPIELRVAYAVNSRLPAMDTAELNLLLESMRDAVLEHFGIEVRFLPPAVVPIARLFDTIPPTRKAAAFKSIYDFKSGAGDRRRLDQAFGRGFHQGSESLADMTAFARTYIGPIDGSGFDAFGARMAALQLERIELWKSRPALDGRPAIDGSPWNEFAMWSALGYGAVPFELVLTNQLIVSVEYASPAVHAALRGGYSNGITSYNRLSRFGTMSIWSTYAFTGNDDQLVQLRAGERYSRSEAARLAGLSGAHELGHQLLHLLHPFGAVNCLMHPVPLFSYRAWAKRLSASQCPLGSNPEVTPGVFKGFAY